MPPAAGVEPEKPPQLPPRLAEQVSLVAAQLGPEGPMDGALMLRLVDAGLLNICEIAEVDFALLNRTLALRAAAELYAQALDGRPRAERAEREAARIRAVRELAALEEVLWEVRPSAMTKAMGAGW